MIAFRFFVIRNRYKSYEFSFRLLITKFSSLPPGFVPPFIKKIRFQAISYVAAVLTTNATEATLDWSGAATGTSPCSRNSDHHDMVSPTIALQATNATTAALATVVVFFT